MATEISVLCTNALKEVVRGLVPVFEEAQGVRLVLTYGPTEGLLRRIKEGIRADVFVLGAEAIADLAKRGRIVNSSRADLARSFIGVAVPLGCPFPDISSAAKMREVLLASPSVAWSKLGVSGLYMPRVLEQLGIAQNVLRKAVILDEEPVGACVARGGAALGIQQVSELMAVEGIALVGPFPGELQKATIFSAGMSSAANDPTTARALVKFLASACTPHELRRHGLETVG